MKQAEALYISASTNRHSHAADISPFSEICFASQKVIALWDASDQTRAGVLVMLPGHHAEINCVKFMRNGEWMVSGDKEGILQLRMKDSGKWEVVLEQSAHAKSIISLATYDNFVVTGSSDATVRLWRFTPNGKHRGFLNFVQCLDMKGRYPLDLQLTIFPDTSCLILAIASTGREIDIWTKADIQFVRSASLSGHGDWVKCLAFTRSRRFPPQLTLASGSQDGTIRLWTFDDITLTRSHPSGDDIMDASEASVSELSEGEEGVTLISTTRQVVTFQFLDGNRHHLSLVFDALLVGHDGGITSLSWRPSEHQASSTTTLLSTSSDSSLILWSPTSLPSASAGQASESLWINRQRFGDVGGQRFGGFVGGLWANNGCEVLGWGWNGGWRRWRCQAASMGYPEIWEEVGAITGHQGVVKSVAWASHGEYLISTGLDQTTRIHGPDREVWHELSRPQVHGYEILGAEFISPFRFVSIADEKVARVFDAPKRFVATVSSLSAVQVPMGLQSYPTGANVPPLGLSNKATPEDEGQGTTVLSLAKRCPFESELGSMTLWPEVEKVYGHGYELFAMATSHSGSLFVTACKSTTAEHAVLRVYSTRDWQLVGEPLAGHTLTVTRLAFSPDDQMILSVSRDRSWRLFRANAQGGGYTPLAMSKSHGRVIWDCAWMINNSENVGFATASRDKTVKVWLPADESASQWTAVTTLTFTEAATAIDFSPVLHDGRQRLAIGLESGEIFIYSTQADTSHWLREMAIDTQIAHVDTVHRISWRPSRNTGSTQQLATCSEDCSIRVIMVHLDFH